MILVPVPLPSPAALFVGPVTVMLCYNASDLLCYADLKKRQAGPHERGSHEIHENIPWLTAYLYTSPLHYWFCFFREKYVKWKLWGEFQTFQAAQWHHALCMFLSDSTRKTYYWFMLKECCQCQCWGIVSEMYYKETFTLQYVTGKMSI